MVPISIGSSGISLALDSNSGHTGYQASGSLFDLFVFNDSGTIRLVTGPAWTNSTTRSAAISQQNGIWTNTSSMTAKFDATSSTKTVAANQGTYVGTMYATANGQTGMAFKPAAASGGANNILGLDNAYNRVKTTAISRDSTSSWTDTSGSWRAANSSNSNRISFVDGLGQHFCEANYQVACNASATSVNTANGVSFNTVGDPGFYTSCQVTSNITMTNQNIFDPTLGFNYAQAVEIQSGGGTGTFFGGGYQSLKISLEM
jgi:hypothetical protein